MKVAALNTVLHAPSRLQTAALLAQVGEAKFAAVRDMVEVSDSVLSKHLSALSETNYVTLRKAALDGRQRTWVSLTHAGRAAVPAHMKPLHALVDAARAVIAA